MIRLVILSVLLSCTTLTMSGQSSDSLYTANMRTVLSLNDAQFAKIDSIYRSTQIQILAIDKQIQSISRSELSQEEKNTQTSELTRKKKDIKEVRELDMLLLMTEEQKKLYHEKIKTNAPSVVHFGVNHDRASCTVCIAPKP